MHVTDLGEVSKVFNHTIFVCVQNGQHDQLHPHMGFIFHNSYDILELAAATQTVFVKRHQCLSKKLMSHRFAKECLVIYHSTHEYI